MKLFNSNKKEFLDYLKGKKIVFYGAGKMLSEIEEELPSLKDLVLDMYITDSNYAEIGGTRTVYGKTLNVLNPREVIPLKDNTILLVSSGAYEEIIEKIADLASEEDIVYAYPLIRIVDKEQRELYIEDKPLYFEGKDSIIPKTIHYFWVGDNPMPDSLKRNVDNWHEKCPDYEIKLWNEKNINLNECQYALEAYEAKKYGFVPDYFRLKVVFEHGGIYLDTDVELLKPLDDLLRFEGYAGFEDSEHVAFGVGFGARKKMPIIKKLYEVYQTVHFVDDVGNLNLTSSPHYQTEVLKKYGLIANGKRQNIEGLEILPMNYLTAQSWRTGLNYITNSTYSIHHYEATWLDESEKKKQERIKKMLRGEQ